QAEITSFVFAGLSPAVQATITGNTITATVPFGTSLASLVPTIGLSAGATVSPASGVARDFRNSVSYTVTAANGSTQRTYSVQVSVAPSSQAEITSFVFAGLSPAVQA
ncbi:DUF5018 domain-containing protein, partial [Arthrospira platensis SPKY1]|nr:DUF5018 domain-containing protein [Arthrospira platensis SPKY1]